MTTMPNNDLISRAAAIAEIEEYIDEYSELDIETGYHNLKWCAMEEAKDVLLTLPAVDAVPVVRCGLCKHRFLDGDNVVTARCELNHNSLMPDDWYCADGEAKEDNGDAR